MMKIQIYRHIILFKCNNNQRYFNKTFFIKDLKDIWKNKFNSSYSTKKLFDKYYIGEIQEGFDLTEAKIRFYKENNYIDITLFISQNERKLNLKQIEINL